jgi:putative ABC transport system substrate-binding protein
VQATIDSLVDSGKVQRNEIEVYNPEGNLDELQSYIRTLSSRSTRLVISVSTPATQATLAARHPSIPLVYSFVSNPSALNLSDKENNFTGIANILDYAKGFELLRKIMPNVKNIGVIYNPSEANSSFSYSQILAEAKKQSPPIGVVSKEFSKAEEINSSMATIPKVDVIYVGGDNTLVQNITLLLQQAELRRIPVFASDEGSVEKGAVGAYSINYAAFGHRTANLALEVIEKHSATGIQPIEYSEGRCVVNSNTLTHFNISFDFKNSGCVVK